MFEPAFHETWSCHLTYQYENCTSNRQKISLLTSIIDRLRFVSALRSKKDAKWVTCTFTCPDKDWEHGVLDSLCSKKRYLIQEDTYLLEQELRRHCSGPFALICENSLLGTHLSRIRGTKIYRISLKSKHRKKGNVWEMPDYFHKIPKKHFSDGYSAEYSSSLLQSRLKRHYHAILSLEDYRNLQVQSKHMRSDLGIMMKKAPGRLETPLDMEKLSSYLIKCNLVPSSNSVRFNRHKCDLPMPTSKHVDARLEWYNLCKPVYSFTGKTPLVEKVIGKLVQIVELLEEEEYKERLFEKACRESPIVIEVKPKIKPKNEWKWVQGPSITLPRWRCAFFPWKRVKTTDPPLQEKLHEIS